MATKGFTREDCEWIIEDANKSWKLRGYGSWAVVDKASGSLAGWAGFKFWKEGEVELLSVLGPDFWGFGREV